MSLRLQSLLPWLAGYTVFITAAIWATCAWRNATMVHLNTPGARQEWLDYQEGLTRQEAKPNATVKHKISTRDEPPLLVWLRERFAAILAAVVVFGSLFYGMAMFLIRGLWPSKTQSFHDAPTANLKP